MSDFDPTTATPVAVPDINAVYDALRRAHAAGDTASAQRLADHIRARPEYIAAQQANLSQPATAPNAQDMSRVYAALQAADASGDTDGARVLAQFIRSQQAAASADATPQPDNSVLGTLNRTAGLTERALLTGATGIPLMLGDGATAAYNLAGNAINRIAGNRPTPNAVFPSTAFNNLLTRGGMPVPQGAERIPFAGISLLTGMKVPTGLPGPAVQAPAQFVPPAMARAQLTATALQNAQGQGFTVPPSTTNPSLINRIVETIAGKQNVQNFSRIGNDQARTAIASRALGLNPDAPLTQGAVQAVKAEAGNAYNAGRAVPQFGADSQFADDMAAVLKEHAGANESFPGAASPDLEKLVDTYFQPTMTGNSVVSAVKLLRGKANDAFSSGNGEMGRAYKGISQALEDQLERAAQAPGSDVNPDVVQAIKSARQRYATASLVQDSMQPDGTVTGPGLAAAWRDDEPITGDLRDAAEFAAQYPKANYSASASGSPVSHWGLGGAGLAGMAGEVIGNATGDGHGLLPMVAGAIAYPAARLGARSYLLSGRGQNGALPSLSATGAPGAFPGAAMQAAAQTEVQPSDQASAFLRHLDQVEAQRNQTQISAAAVPAPPVGPPASAATATAPPDDSSTNLLDDDQ